MQPTSYMLPSIFNLHTDRSLIDLKNEYSIVNRLQSRDVLGNFSMQLQNKLPRINKRLRTIEDKENQLIARQNKMAGDRQVMQFLQKDINDMRMLLLNSHKNCCCQSHANRMIMPFQPYQMPNHQCQNQDQKDRSKQPRKSNQSSSQNLDKKNTKKNGKKPGRNFRKFVYAVYFCIYLKYYSAKFTKNRYQFFKQRYLSNNGQKVKQDSYKITKSLEGIDLLKIMVQSSQSISDKVSSLTLASSKNFDPTGIDRLIPQKIASQFQKALNFTNLYIKQLQKIILSPKFVDFYGQIIGIGTVNQSFFMDDLMIPQQIQFITFSQKKGFAKINPQTEKILIMTYIFIKHILFKILLKLKERKFLQTKLKENYEKFEDEKDDIYDFFDLSNAILYSLINTVFLQYMQDAPKTNYDNLKKRFKISPAKVLTAPTCPKNLKQTINYEQLIAGVPKIDQITAFLQDERYDDYLGYLVEQIENLSQKLLEKVRYVNKAIYNHMKLQTLDQSYLIFEGIKNEKNSNLKTTKTIAQITPNNQKSGVLNTGSRFSNTSLGMNSKMFKKSKN